MEFEDFKVEFHAPEVVSPAQETFAGAAPSRDLEEVPVRPKKGAVPKAMQLNKDYDAWTAATPRPIFEKKEA